MPKYTGQQCTSCRIEFTENDDIVVCPECGSPYHRDCYKKEGRCVNTLLHEKGGEWKAAPVNNTQSSSLEKACPNCGQKNSPDAAVCSLCGISLDNSHEPRQSCESYGPNPWQNQQNGSPMGQQNMNMPPFLNVYTISPETDVDGNTAGEYAAYIGMKYMSYLPKFMRFAKGGSKLSFNFPALYIPSLWFFYRKMPIQGIITATVSIITSFPTLFENMAALGWGYSSLTNDPRFELISNVFFVVRLLLGIFCGFFGNYMYYRKAKSDIDSVKAEMPNASGRLEIARRGGTSVPLVALSMVVQVVANWIIVAALWI